MKNIFSQRRISHKSPRGFTLIELVVVIGLFSAIATLSLGSLFNAQTINSKLQDTQSILDNINLSTLTITRDIRFGTEFYCVAALPTPIYTTRKNCPEATTVGGIALIFKASGAASSTDRTMYYLSNGILYKDIYSGGSTTTLQMTSSEVKINNLTFYVDGAQTSDGSNDDSGAKDYTQPIISLLISGTTQSVHKSVAPVSFSLQTAVSPVDIDNK
jgi:prepilin-type N-terminal cleavage/methylation domain-containing protein